MSHDRSYQIECPDCSGVAVLEARADLLQTFIRSVLPRPFWASRSADQLTERQQGAIDWSVGINNCLRRAMEQHSRCHACSVLMGPGHIEGGNERFCGTHIGVEDEEAGTRAEEWVDRTVRLQVK